jgi:hypothetical protein
VAGAGAPAVGARFATWSAEPELWKAVAVSVESLEFAIYLDRIIYRGLSRILKHTPETRI